MRTQALIDVLHTAKAHLAEEEQILTRTDVQGFDRRVAETEAKCQRELIARLETKIYGKETRIR